MAFFFSRQFPVFLCFWMLKFSCSFAQSDQKNLIRWGKGEGLSQNDVFCILQNRQGFMWMGTEEGLNKFDGANFTPFRPQQGDPHALVFHGVRAMVEEDNGVIWVGTLAGLNSYQPENNRFEAMGGDVLERADVRALCLDQANNLWVGTSDQGLWVREQGVFKTYLPGVVCNSLIEDHAGNIWLGTNSGLFCKAGNRPHFEPVSTFDQSQIIRTFAVDQQNNLWIGTYSGGLWKLAENSHEVVAHYTTENGLNANQVVSLATDHQQGLWIGTENQGLQFLDLKSEKAAIHTIDATETPIRYSTITAIYADNQGRIWLGVYGKGIFMHDPYQPFKQVTYGLHFSKGLTHSSVRSVLKMGDQWLLGTDGGGLNVYNTLSGNISNQQLPDFSRHILSLERDQQGNIWVGSYGKGAYLWNGQRNKPQNYSHLLIEHNVWALKADLSGDGMWMGTSKGLFFRSLDGRRTEKYTHQENDDKSLGDNDVRALMQDVRGDLWVGSFGGLSRFSKKEQRFYNYPISVQMERTLGVMSILEDDHLNIWVGTFGGGVFRFDRSTEKFEPVESLRNLQIFSMVAGQDQQVWMSSNVGIHCFDPRNQQVRFFNIPHDLSLGNFNYGAGVCLEDGTITFGNTEGLVFFNPDAVELDSPAAPVRFTKFELIENVPENRAVFIQEGEKNDEVRLSAGENSFTVNFACLDYGNTRNIGFRYRVGESKDQWVDIGQQRRVTFTDYPSGAHEFHLQAYLINAPDQMVGSRTLNIDLEPRYYETIYFKVLVLLGIMMMIALAWRIKEKNWQHQQTVLNSKVAERTRALQAQKERLQSQNSALEKAERENHELLKAQFSERLYFRERELTAHTLNTIAKNELLKRVKSDLEVMVKKDQSKATDIKGVLHKIDASLEMEQDWKTFNALFAEVHQDFVHNLKSQHPDLTDYNLRLCYLYRLDLSSKDIATTLGISLNSVKVARHRLRKKLNLSEEADLLTYLHGFM